MKDWTKFVKRIVIESSIEEVYRSWATQSSIETWFLEKANFRNENQDRTSNELFQKGDNFKWKWNNWDTIFEGKILEANGEDLLSFTFGAGGLVHIQLKELGKATELCLTQEEIPTDDDNKMDQFVGCSNGWTFWLTNLKAFLEHGITLHATNLNQDETKNLVNS